MSLILTQRTEGYFIRVSLSRHGGLYGSISRSHMDPQKGPQLSPHECRHTRGDGN